MIEIKHLEVQDYYGNEIQSTADLKTTACCAIEEPPAKIKEVLSEIHDEVHAKFYGCGLTIPKEVKGLRVLDLGSGSGRDCFVMSKLVGETGEVVGVDMTPEQLAVANKYIPYHTDKFGYRSPNISFMKGNIENLDELELEEGSFDLIISNCVINLVINKKKVFKDVYRLLKPGGEMYFSDVYSDRRVPEELQKDPILWGECLSGALYWNDFLKFTKEAGFTDPRAVESRKLNIENPQIAAKCGELNFYSVTYRLFKIDGLENDCEDYGQAVSYKGSIEENEHSFRLDDHHIFQTGKVVPVCGNSYLMLKESRLANHFEFYGNFNTHYGIFEGCGTNMPFNDAKESESQNSCC